MALKGAVRDLSPLSHLEDARELFHIPRGALGDLEIKKRIDLAITKGTIHDEGNGLISFNFKTHGKNMKVFVVHDPLNPLNNNGQIVTFQFDTL